MTARHLLIRLGFMCLTAGLLAVTSVIVARDALAQRPTKAAPKKATTAEEADPQTKKDEAQKPAGKPAKKEAAAKIEPNKKNEPQPADLETDDGVLIAATYFPSTQGKSAPVIMLLHSYGEGQRMWDDVAFGLQDRGYAVFTFDFRGHGSSKSVVRDPTQEKVEKKAGLPTKLEYSNFRTAPQLLTLLEDIETAKRFLVRRNNAGELNLSKLGVVGCELGATLAILWSHRDWQYPAQTGFAGKQGQDVQALSLISPTYNYKGIAVTKELAYMQRVVPIQVTVGKKKKKTYDPAEAVKMYEAARKARPTEQDSDLKEVDTELQGRDLLNLDHGFGVDKAIVKFFDAALKNKPARWEAREVSDSEAGQ
jgi:alpha-beta hydrolase superfamily lysophospholipase